jgi:signal transduction histidine kinase
VQHDMRNLSQWVALVADDLEHCQTSEELLASAQRIQQGAAMARDRAQRITSALSRPSFGMESAADWQDLAISRDLTQAAAMHQVTLLLDPALTPETHCHWHGPAWATVLDNLLGNISRLSREAMVPAQCTVRWAVNDKGASLAFDTPDLPVQVPLQQLFEPWNGASPGGSGLGLYQARRAVVAAGGDLLAAHCGTGLTVTLYLHRKES